MPVGPFRTNPRDISPAQREEYARQLPEGLHVLGSGLGLAVPILIGQYGPLAETMLGSPLTAVLGLLVGGIGGYLLGHWLLQRRLAALSTGQSQQASHSADAPDSTAEADQTTDPR